MTKNTSMDIEKHAEEEVDDWCKKYKLNLEDGDRVELIKALTEACSVDLTSTVRTQEEIQAMLKPAAVLMAISMRDRKKRR